MVQINIVPEQLASLNEGPELLVCYLQPPTHTHWELQLNKWVITEVMKKVEINTQKIKEHLI